MPELALSQWLFLIVITLGAGIVQSATGFGFAVIAVPFFLLALDSLTVIQINIVLNLFNALVVVPRIWRLASTRWLKGLVGGTLIGLPVGMVVFNMADVEQMKIGVAVIIIGFAIHLIIKSRSENVDREPRTGTTWGVGGVSGALTSSLAMPGPPVLIYLAHFDVEKNEFRAVNLTLYVVSYSLALAMQATWGGMTASTWLLSIALIPVAAIGGVVGHRLSPYLSERVFRASVLVTLLITGVYMLYATVGID